MKREQFFKNDMLNFAEARFSVGSTSPFKPHMRRTFSIGAVDTGEVLYRVGTQEIILRPGSIAVINPEVLHSCNPVSRQGRSYYMLYLDVKWCLRVQQTMWDTVEFIESGQILIDDPTLYDQYCHLMKNIFQPQIFLQEKEQYIFDLAVTVFSSACIPGRPVAHKNIDIERLRNLLQKDLQKDLPLDALAKQLGINPYTLIRSFKSATGITPHAYRMNCRIDYARQLLGEGKSITEAAYLSGFFDQSHFHRHFKAMTSITPREYRVNFVQ